MSQCRCSAAVAVAGIREVAECLRVVAVSPSPLQVSERWLSVSVPLQCRRCRCRYPSGGRVSQCRCSVAVAVAGIRAMAECLSAVAVPPLPLQVSEWWPSVSVPLQCRRRRCRYLSGGRVSQCRCSAAVAVAGIRAVAECLSAIAVRWPSVSVPLQCRRRHCRYPSGGRVSQCRCSAAIAVAGIRVVAECLSAVAVPSSPLQVSERWPSVSVPLQCRRRRCRYPSGGRVSQCHCSVAVAVAGIPAVAECLSAVAVPPPPLRVSERWPSVSVPLQCRRRRCRYPSGG